MLFVTCVSIQMRIHGLGMSLTTLCGQIEWLCFCNITHVRIHMHGGAYGKLHDHARFCSIVYKTALSSCELHSFFCTLLLVPLFSP